MASLKFSKAMFVVEAKHYTHGRMPPELLVRLEGADEAQSITIEQTLEEFDLEEHVFGDEDEIDVTVKDAQAAQKLFEKLTKAGVVFANAQEVPGNIKEAAAVLASAPTPTPKHGLKLTR